MHDGSQRGRLAHPLRLASALLFGAALALAPACKREHTANEGRVSRAQADEYLRDAVRMSSEGVLLEPSIQGLSSIERVRFGEIAQELRGPGALCFVERAINTMEFGEVDGEPGWMKVPEGQIKIRVRVAVDGRVLATEVLDTGFVDDYMETCLSEAIEDQRFPESRDSFAYHIDLYYWVSLGLFRKANTEAFAELMRRQRAEVGVRGKGCLEGRVKPGSYSVTGLNLFGRDGQTVVNRIDRGELPAEVGTCLASTFKAMRIHSEPDAFIRPAQIEIEYEVAEDGAIAVTDDRWLELIELEEKAERERRKAELMGGSSEAPEDDRLEPAPGSDSSGPARPRPLDLGPVDSDPGTEGPADLGPAPAADGEDEPPAPEAKPELDPAKPGTKIDLSPRRNR